MGLINCLEDFSFLLAKKKLLGFGYAIEVICFISCGVAVVLKDPISLFFNLLNGGIWSYIVGKGIYYSALIQ